MIKVMVKCKSCLQHLLLSSSFPSKYKQETGLASKFNGYFREWIKKKNSFGQE